MLHYTQLHGFFLRSRAASREEIRLTNWRTNVEKLFVSTFRYVVYLKRLPCSPDRIGSIYSLLCLYSCLDEALVFVLAERHHNARSRMEYTISSWSIQKSSPHPAPLGKSSADEDVLDAVELIPTAILVQTKPSFARRDGSRHDVVFQEHRRKALK